MAALLPKQPVSCDVCAIAECYQGLVSSQTGMVLQPQGLGLPWRPAGSGRLGRGRKLGQSWLSIVTPRVEEDRTDS